MFKKSLFILTIVALSAYGLSAKEGKDAVHKPATEGAEPGKWTQDYDAAIKMAAEKGLPLMLNFTGSDWCGWCKIMDKNVFADEKDWGPYAKENLMLVTLDFPKDKSIVPEKWVHRNEKLKDKFGVRGFPTYVVLDSNGESKLGQLGASREATPKSFVQQAKGVLRFSKSAIAAFTAKLSEEKPLNTRACYLPTRNPRRHWQTGWRLAQSATMRTWPSLRNSTRISHPQWPRSSRSSKSS